MIKKLDIPSTSRLFFVSDIHGEIGTLLEGLSSLGFVAGKDVCVCAGDLIDRGRESLKTVEWFLNDTTGSFYSVLGNHDVFSFENNTNETGQLWYINGGDWAFDSMSMDELKSLGERVRAFPYAIEVDYLTDTEATLKIGVTHASVPEGFDIWQDFLDMLTPDNKGLQQVVTWDRNFVEYPHCEDYQIPLYGVDFTVHGHTPVREPLRVGNRWHIDTGLVYGKKLTIAEVLPKGRGELEFHSFGLL